MIIAKPHPHPLPRLTLNLRNVNSHINQGPKFDTYFNYIRVNNYSYAEQLGTLISGLFSILQAVTESM